MKNKKRILGLILVIISTSLFGCSSTKASTIKSGKDITFFVTSDTHYLAKNLTDGGQAFQEFIKTGDGKELNYMQQIMDSFTRDIKNKNPDVLILSGDLTSNGEKDSHLELAKRLSVIEKTGTRVYVIPGNHDILNPYARGFKGSDQYVVSSITKDDFSKIYGDFGYKEAISRDKNTLSYLAAPSDDVWLLMLDTAQYDNNLVLGYPQTGGRIDKGTMEWIKQCSALAKSKGAKLIAVMHHSLINHSDIVSKDFTIDNSNDAIALFKELNIDLTLSGHLHLQDIKSNSSNGKTIYDIASSCIDIYPQKYGVLKYSPKNGIDYTTTSVDVEGWAKETNQKDKNLLNFKEYSKESYGNTLYEKNATRLSLSDDYTAEQVQLMCATYKDIYLRYYEGDKVIVTDEIKNSEGYKLWTASKSNKNLLKLANINGEVNNILHISTSSLANDK
ncbi:metallophosphoesterase [Candidatus Clostridium stratigraminis]|uniref:Metallophosphoesterase n=1 Tax=Candidatus Clostridium stratigraminis TaxID=3381661 RepID=A0ABW8T7H3_9CLOT